MPTPTPHLGLLKHAYLEAAWHLGMNANLDALDGLIHDLQTQKAPLDHAHAVAEVTGLDGALATKADLVEGRLPKSQLPALVPADVQGLAEALAQVSNTPLPAWLRDALGLPPDPPHPWSDEFSGPALDPAWAWTNRGDAQATLVAPQGLLLSAPVEGFSAIDFRVLAKPIAGDFDVRARLELYRNVTRYNQVGFAALSSSGAFIALRLLGNDGPCLWDIARFASPTVYASQVMDGVSQPSPTAHVRLRLEGSLLHVAWSHDGRFWWEPAPPEPIGPGHPLIDVAAVGLVWSSSNSVWPVAAYVPWVRRLA